MFTPNATSSFNFSTSLVGAKNAITQLNQSAQNIASAEPTLDLTNEVISQIKSKHEFSANLSVIKTTDETLGTLLDISG